MQSFATKHILLSLIIVMVVASCSTAQRATDVDAIRVPIAPYLKMTCQELATEQNSLVSDARAAGAKVDDSYRSDKNTELVTWVLFWPAVFWMDGNQGDASKLASLKGQLDTIQEAQKVNKCSL
jgi:hypothetical protein